MKRIILLLLIAGLRNFAGMAQMDSINIYYFQNYPYAFSENTDPLTGKSQVKGIEVEILEEFVVWMKQKKNIPLKVQYWVYTDFSNFFTAVKNGRPSVVGIGSVTWQTEREKEVRFAPTHLMNQSVLITEGKSASIRDENKEEVATVLGNLKAVTLAQSSHEKYLKEIKNNFLPQLQLVYTSKATAVLDSIGFGKGYFGYSDIVTYWTYLKNHPQKYLKIQKALSTKKEELACILPKTNSLGLYLDEFFESGFGFTATKTYRQILETYLGYEIIDYVEVK